METFHRPEIPTRIHPQRFCSRPRTKTQSGLPYSKRTLDHFSERLRKRKNAVDHRFIHVKGSSFLSAQDTVIAEGSPCHRHKLLTRKGRLWDSLTVYIEADSEATLANLGWREAPTRWAFTCRRCYALCASSADCQQAVKSR